MPLLADMLGGWEILLILAVVFILFGAARWPGMTRGLGEGLIQFRKRLDQEAHEVGASLGGIHGKPAAEALTPDNQTAELYDPAVFHRRPATRRMRFRRWLQWWRSFWRSVLKCLNAKS
jgi:TatA/E family protein of Tat protein translocase